VRKIRREYDALKTQGMKVEYLDEEEALRRYRVNCPGALLIEGDADMDPVAFIHSLTAHNLEEDLDTDILIIGTGISGTLCAYVLSGLIGERITMVDAKGIGEGSSRANTGLLQVSSDTMLSEFIDEIGEEKARGFYRMCEIAMDDLFEIDEKLALDNLRRRKSLYCASNEEDVRKIRREYDALKTQGMKVEYLDEEEALRRYRVNCPGALLIEGDADVDPVAFIHSITAHNLEEGVSIYPHTEIDLESRKDHEIRSADGHTIRFRYCVFATGYATKYELIRDRISINRTYAFVTEPVEEEPWPEEVMIWETKDPYLYLRTTKNRRIVAGGMDEEKDELVRDQDYIDRKVKALKKDVSAMMADDLKLDVDKSYNALFGTVKDGLPLLGADPENANHFYILGYEGNGTCYSMAGARIIKNLITGEDDPFREIVRLDR
ncbi:MAG TPA: FAD-dependent oxidoreductase, partial [Bacteroidales bacterium]|nr:FAD-dependent oxidoreductase [Bacteroidales bacterium]